MMDKPKRRYELELSASADDLDSLIGLFRLIEFVIASEPEDTPRNIVSGGYSSSYILDLSIQDDITHETWSKEIAAYLAEKKGGE